MMLKRNYLILIRRKNVYTPSSLDAGCRMVIKDNGTTQTLDTDTRCNAPTVVQIPNDQIASSEGAAIKIDRSATRYWPESHTFGHTGIPELLGRIITEITPHVHEAQPNLMVDHPLTVLDQLLIRITRTNNMDEGYSPTPEGIHQDNTQVSGTHVYFWPKSSLPPIVPFVRADSYYEVCVCVCVCVSL